MSERKKTLDSSREKVVHLGCIVTLVQKRFIACLYATIVERCVGAKRRRRKTQRGPLGFPHATGQARQPPRAAQGPLTLLVWQRGLSSAVTQPHRP